MLLQGTQTQEGVEKRGTQPNWDGGTLQDKESRWMCQLERIKRERHQKDELDAPSVPQTHQQDGSSGGARSTVVRSPL